MRGRLLSARHLSARHLSARRLIGLAAVALLVCIALGLAPLPPQQDLAAAFAAPGAAHPLGTDDLGRDLLHQVGLGLRTSLALGLGATAIALLLGLGIGLAAGMGSALQDEVLMRGADVVASLPALLLAILVAALFGGSTVALAWVLGLTRWPLVARLVRVEVASLRQREFVLAARALGASPWRIARVHLLPHAATVARAALGILFGGAVVSEAALAFVGLGDPAVVSLGQLAASGFGFVTHAPWLWAAPVVVIVVLTASVAALGDALVDQDGGA